MRPIGDLTGHENINGLYTDYLVEVYAAGLVDYGFSLDDIHVIRRGGSVRGVSKDIDGVSVTTYSQEINEPSIRIHANRNSMYDAMPESIFHISAVAGKARSRETAIHEMRQHREEEENLRRFFRLFEMELDRNLILISLDELHFNKKYAYDNFVEAFVDFWPFLKKLERRGAVLFLSLVPYIHRIRNNYGEIASALSLVLDVPVTIEQETGRACYKHTDSKLSGIKLGRNFVTSGDLNDRAPEIEVVLGPMTSQKVMWFVTQGEGETVVEALMDIFIDADTNYRIRLKVQEQEKHFSFRSGKRLYLGINTKFR